MKILHITRDFPPRANGGISTAVGGLTSALHRIGFECDVVSFDGYRPRAKAPCPGPPVEEHGQAARTLRVTHPEQLERASKWAIERESEIVHCHHDLLWSFAKSLDADHTIATAHILQWQQNRVRGLRGPTLSSAAQDRTMLEADRIFAPSLSTADALMHEYPASATKVELVRLAIDDRSLNPQPREGIIYLGRFSDVRGLGDVLAAIPLFAPAHPRNPITLVGGAPDNPRGDKRWRAQIGDCAKAAGIEIETPGWVSREASWHFLERAKIALVPSWSETFGMAAAEAMLAGCAVIASDLGPLRELVTPETGVLVPPRSPPAMAEAIACLLTYPERCSTLGMAARAHIQEFATWDRRVEESRRAYERIAG